jgi:hypothetical protein
MPLEVRVLSPASLPGIPLPLRPAATPAAVLAGLGRFVAQARTSQPYYKWAIRRIHGQHTATFKSYDWMGNVGVLPVTFNVN